MVSFFSVVAHTKKIKKQTDIITFGWENNTGAKGTKNNKWTKAEIEKIKADGHPLFK